jgi:hypothetical protein
VLYDWVVALKKADDVMEDLDNDYPYITYAICTFVATGIVAIFLYRCLRCATDKTKNMHTENKTTVNTTKNNTINKAGDTHNNTQNTQNTSVNDHRNIQINLKYINMQLPMQLIDSQQLPMQLMDSQITAKKPTRKSPRGHKSPRHICM